MAGSLVLFACHGQPESVPVEPSPAWSRAITRPLSLDEFELLEVSDKLPTSLPEDCSNAEWNEDGYSADLWKRPLRTFDVAKDGTIRYRDEVLLAPGTTKNERTYLHAHFKVLRELGLAAGWLSIEAGEQQGKSHECIAQPFVVRLAEGAPWSPVAALFWAASQPDVAFHKIELTGDTSNVPLHGDAISF